MPRDMKILVTGSREWKDWATIYKDLLPLPPGSIVVHGGARGADRIAGRLAQALDHVVRIYTAQWDLYGRSAGPIRNQQMLKEEHLNVEPIEYVLAYPLPQSMGTRDMILRAVKAGIPVVYPDR